MHIIRYLGPVQCGFILRREGLEASIDILNQVMRLEGGSASKSR
jgi:hypothetical protein